MSLFVVRDDATEESEIIYELEVVEINIYNIFSKMYNWRHITSVKTNKSVYILTATI